MRFIEKNTKLETVLINFLNLFDFSAANLSGKVGFFSTWKMVTLLIGCVK